MSQKLKAIKLIESLSVDQLADSLELVSAISNYSNLLMIQLCRMGTWIVLKQFVRMKSMEKSFW